MTWLDPSKFKKSSIGTHVESDESELEIINDYSFMGLILLWVYGATVYPKEIKFKCKKTGEIFEVINKKGEPEKMKHYMLYRKR